MQSPLVDENPLGGFLFLCCNDGMYKSILVISDTHFPYNHPDVIAFLRHLKQKHKPDKIVHIGDEIDWHSISFHDHDPDLMSPSDELQTAINRLKPLYKLFPCVDVMESNHGSLVYRMGKVHGLPRAVFKSYREVIEAPKGWQWHRDLILKSSNGQQIYFCHGLSADGLKLSQSMGMCVTQGHFHEKFEIRYWGNKLGLYWSAMIGCLVDDSTLAFEYNKVNLKRPLIGCLVIRDGLPVLEPMVLKANGRWRGH